MPQPKSKLTKQERALLRQFAGQAWEAELDSELENLFEDFCKWADKGLSGFELSEKIHEFHNGVSRELYNRYTALNPEIAVSRAVAIGILGEEELGATLSEKLSQEIDAFRTDTAEC